MASGGGRQLPFSPVDKEVEYNQRLYKSMLNFFSNQMPAMQLRDSEPISDLLTVRDMERVQCEFKNNGSIAAATCLLDCMKMKPKWFNALMKAMDIEELKISGFKPRMKEIKEKVDQDWVKDHPTLVANPSTSSFDLPAPTQSEDRGNTGRPLDTDGTDRRSDVAECGDGGHNVSSKSPTIGEKHLRVDVQVNKMAALPAGEQRTDGEASAEPRNDFYLTPVEGLERDAVEEGVEDLSLNETAQRPTSATQDSREQGRESEEYRDAQSEDTDNIYEALGNRDEEEDYATLVNSETMERDAAPLPMQESGVPEPEVGVTAEPQVHTAEQVRRHRRPRPRTRAEHPSLRNAISDDPDKDFEEGFVREELSALPGWTSNKDEHRVIRLVKHHRGTIGYYVLWYWSLAKRPTICVTHEGRVITFVVHKSSTSNPVKYYINRRQKKSESLQQLVQFHLQNGIRYTAPGREEAVVELSNPYTRQQQQ